MRTILKFSSIAVLLQALTSHALTVTNIARGSEARHTLFLKSDGSLWAMGDNYNGQLGAGTLNRTNRPVQIVASGVMAIAVGNSHSLFVKTNGSLWAMGGNSDGQLGNGTLNNTNRPIQIVTNGVTAIAAGYSHSLFIKTNGSLGAMGRNTGGQLGDGTLNSTNRPEQIVSSGVAAVAAGAVHSLFIKTNGSLWAMGINAVGQLGDGTFNNTNQPEQIVASGVTAIAAGFLHSLFLKSDGSFWAMGDNRYGQLGDGTFQTNSPYGTNWPEQIVASGVAAIAAGETHSLFLKFDGSLWAMGYNPYGQLGDGTFQTNSPYGTNQPEQIVASDVTAIAAGVFHSLFIKSDGSLWGMGDDDLGQLGDGFPANLSSLPVQILPLQQPVLSSALLSKTNLQFTATCEFGGSFRLLGSTNINTPVSQWTPIRTNSVTVRGTNNFSYIMTNAVNSGGRRFYILQSQ